MFNKLNLDSMKIFNIRIIIFLIAFIPIYRLNAQSTSIHADVENLLSKKYLLKKDVFKMDSLLSLIEDNYGIENEDYFKLANTKLKNSYSSKKESLLPILKNLDVLYQKGFGDNKQYEFFLRKKCQICTFGDKMNEDSIFNTYALLWDIHKKNLTKEDTVDFKLLDEYCLKCSLKGRYELLSDLRLEALDLNRSLYTDKSPEYDKALKNLVLSFNQRIYLGDMDDNKKKELFLLSSKYYKEWLLRQDIQTSIKDDTYNNIFTSYTSGLLFLCNDSIEAKKWLDKYCVAIKYAYGENSEQYYKALDSKKESCGEDEQIQIMKEMLRIAENVWGKDSYQYQNDLNMLSLMMQQQGNLREAVKLQDSYNEDAYINSLLESPGFSDMSDEAQDTFSNNMKLTGLDSNSLLNSMYGNWSEANASLKEIMYNCIDDLSNPLSRLNFQSSYMSIINNYDAQNKRDSIIALGQEFVPLISDENLAIQVLMNVNSACRQGEALDFVTKMIVERPSLAQCIEYPAFLESIAEMRGRNGDMDSALKCIEEAFSLRENTTKNQIRKLIQEEILFALNKNYTEAFERNKKSQEMFSQIPDYEKYMEYAGLRMRACLEGVRLGKYEQVIENGEYIKSLNYPDADLQSYLYDNIMLSQMSSLFYILQMPLKDYVIVPLIEAYISTHADDKALTLLIEYAKDTEKTVRSSLALVGPATNVLINIQQICDIAQGELAKSAVALSNNQVNELAYNNALLSKQLLLNASDRMKEFILTSSDEETIKKYNELISTQSLMDNAAYTGLSIDSLYQRKKTLEVQLNADSKLFGDYTKKLGCSWKDVQKALRENECAIEFVQYTEDEINYNYIALVLLPDKEPMSIYICSDNDIEKIKKLYNDSSAGKLIWGPIISKIGNTKTIYFSPVGNLHLLGMENFLLSDSTLISDKYKLYRVSSTRMLIEDVSQKSFANGILYGGLTYNESMQTMIDNSQKYIDRNVYRSSNVGNSLNLRNGVAYLPSTKTEVDEIEQLLGNLNIHPAIFFGEKGTEDSFKSFSGQGIDFIHIATHGFYWNEKEAKLKSKLGFISSFVGNDVDKEDQAMVRSGLLFSGANNALMSKPIPDNIDDGILTAKEISSLDLSSVGIVVLSACQTGVGEISGDGVFGLQRGFKKAGVHTLLMSLWSVDDNATRLLMKKFYENIILGKSKLESLHEAQRYVREYEIEKEIKENKGVHLLSAQAKEQAQKENMNKTIKKIRPYENPKYWAAFILLDAI